MAKAALVLPSLTGCGATRTTSFFEMAELQQQASRAFEKPGRKHQTSQKRRRIAAARRREPGRSRLDPR